jgi:hypothetical protein
MPLSSDLSQFRLLTGGLYAPATAKPEVFAGGIVSNGVENALNTARLLPPIVSPSSGLIADLNGMKFAAERTSGGTWINPDTRDPFDAGLQAQLEAK